MRNQNRLALGPRRSLGQADMDVHIGFIEQPLRLGRIDRQRCLRPHPIEHGGHKLGKRLGGVGRGHALKSHGVVQRE